MQSKLIAVIAALAVTSSAEEIWVRILDCVLFECFKFGRWVTSHGTYDIDDAKDGCRKPGRVPYVDRVCFDWSSNKRGHFYAENQPKRCFKQSQEMRDCGARCYTTIFDEVPCTWRIAEERSDESFETTPAGVATMFKA